MFAGQITALSRPGKQSKALQALVWACVVIGAVALLDGYDGSRARVSNVSQLLAAATASVAALRRAIRTPNGGSHLWLVAAAGASWGAGQAIWTVAQWSGGSPPFPSIADAGFLCAYPLLVLAFLRAPISTVRRGALRTALDWTTVSSAVLFVAWAAGLRTMLRASTWTPESVLAISYPVLDIFVLSVLFAVITRSRRCRHTGVMAMASGIGLLAIADSAIAYLTASGEYVTGSVVDAGRVVGWLMIAVAVTSGQKTTPEAVDRVAAVDAVATWAPAVALGAVMLTAVVLQAAGDPFTADPMLFWLGMAMFAANVARVAVAHADAMAATMALSSQLTRYADTVIRYEDALHGAGARIWQWDPSRDEITWSPPVTDASGTPASMTVDEFVTSMHPDDRAAALATVGGAMSRRSPFEITYRRVLADGVERWIRNTAMFHEDPAAGSSIVVGLGVDVTLEHTMGVRDARRLRESEALIEIGDHALRVDELGAFLDATVTSVSAALGAPLTKVLRLDSERRCFVVQAGVGWSPGTVGTATVPTGLESQAGYTLACDQPVVVTDLATETRFEPAALLREHGVRSGMSAVIRSERGPWGVLGAHTTYPVDFEEEDALFLAAVANLVAAVIDRLDVLDRLRRRATHDDLTGLPNRALLLDRLATMTAEARRDRRYSAVVHVGIDRFGLVNETYGYEAGDAVLVDLSARLRSSVPPGATVARYGGDEFVVAALCSDPDEGGDLAAGVLAVIEAPTAVGEPAEEVFLSASAGLALANGAGEPEMLLRNAAAATATAQLRGGGRYEIHDSRLRERSISRLSDERDLRRALDAEQFEPHYQPVVDLRSGRVVGVEALARWRHPTRGLLMPADFLDRAVEVGLAAPLGAAMLRSALVDASTWNLAPDFTVAVNIGAAQLDDDLLVHQLMAALDVSNLDPRHVVLEIIEDDLARDAAAADVLARIKERTPVRVYIDDFGTGHSSLARLHRLPIDGLKIDRTFVSGAAATAKDDALVSTIIALGDLLGLSVVAEGVERDDDWAMLRRLGCRYAQGWRFAAAVPAAEVPALLVATYSLPGGAPEFS